MFDKSILIKNLRTNVPLELQQLNQWIVHDSKKIPYSALDNADSMANSTDNSTWASFERAIEVLTFNTKITGIGFVFSSTDEYCGIDIDHCIESDGKCYLESKNIIKEFSSYTEYSPSETGIHIIVKANKKPEMSRCKCKSPSNPVIHYEMYDTDRYFTFTGNIINDKYTTIKHSQEKAEEFYSTFLHVHDSHIISSIPTKENINFDLESVLLSDEKFNELWNGYRPNGNESSDDLALMNKLAYYLYGDSEKVYEYYMMSNHVATKTEKQLKKIQRNDYMTSTIKKAVGEVVLPKQNITFLPNSNQNQKPVFNIHSVGAFPKLNAKMKPVKVYENLEHLLKMLNVSVNFNQISKRIELKGFPHDIESIDNACVWLNSRANDVDFNVNLDFLSNTLTFIADKHKINPVAGYLTILKETYQGETGYIQKLCDTVITDEDFSKSFKELLITKWLINTVLIAFNNESKFNVEGVLTFQGKQGMGKTRWIRALVPKPLYDYLKTGVELDPKDKDKIYQTIKYWIVELGELDSTFKNDLAKLKAFFTERSDDLRLPYARNYKTYPRMTSFFATVNKSSFLKDDTGNRRYWTIPVKDLDFELLESIDMDLMWCEVMALIDGGMSHYLDKEELSELFETNDEFRVATKTEQKVVAGFIWSAEKQYWKFVSQQNVADHLNLSSTDGLAESMEKMGVKKKRGRCSITKKVMWGYTVPPFNTGITEFIK